MGHSRRSGNETETQSHNCLANVTAHHKLSTPAGKIVATSYSHVCCEATAEPARLVEQVQRMPEMRGDRAEAVRQQIAEGTYETRDKLNVAVEQLLDEIG